MLRRYLRLGNCVDPLGFGMDGIGLLQQNKTQGCSVYDGGVSGRDTEESRVTAAPGKASSFAQNQSTPALLRQHRRVLGATQVGSGSHNI